MRRRSPFSTTVAGRTAAVVTALAALGSGLALASPAQAANVATPGNFTGYGFDQCTAPSQSAMDAWLTRSPYWAVGIYISGASRGCTSQPNLTPTWVSSQLANRWRLLPITLGPQAWCTTRERYLHQVRIDPSPGGAYAQARAQGRAEARKTVGAAQRLGLRTRSTMWYDIEGFDIAPTNCRESALSFLSAWTRALHRHDYVSGVYSSAASGIKMMDDARVNRPGYYKMPDRVWIADWNGRANTSSSYVRSDGWATHDRVHQFRGGHNESYGGVTINIDQNWVDLGKGSAIAPEPAHCGGAASYNYRSYATRSVGDRGALVKTVQCLLTSHQAYSGTVDGVYDAGLGAAVSAYRVSRGLPAGTSTTSSTWVALVSQGSTRLVKRGAASTVVRRLQRALNAADSAGIPVSGIFRASTGSAVKRYQSAHGLSRTGVAGTGVWRRLLAGTT
jgi:peptidoglycan hydrolase-like protein with peptidoglycan-binding domain